MHLEELAKKSFIFLPKFSNRSFLEKNGKKKGKNRFLFLIMRKLCNCTTLDGHLSPFNTEKYRYFLFVFVSPSKRIFRTVIYIRRMHTRGTASVQQQLHLIPIMVVVKSINQHSSANEFPSAFFRGEPNGLGERNRIIFAKYTAVDPPTSTGMSYTRGKRQPWTTLSIKEYFVNVPSTDTYLKALFCIYHEPICNVTSPTLDSSAAILNVSIKLRTRRNALKYTLVFGEKGKRRRGKEKNVVACNWI